MKANEPAIDQREKSWRQCMAHSHVQEFIVYVCVYEINTTHTCSLTHTMKWWRTKSTHSRAAALFQWWTHGRTSWQAEVNFFYICVWLTKWQHLERFIEIKISRIFCVKYFKHSNVESKIFYITVNNIINK